MVETIPPIFVQIRDLIRWTAIPLFILYLGDYFYAFLPKVFLFNFFINTLLVLLVYLRYGEFFFITEAIVTDEGATLIQMAYSLTFCFLIGLYVLIRKDLSSYRNIIITCLVLCFIILLFVGKRGAILSSIFPIIAIYLCSKRTPLQTLFYCTTIILLYYFIIENIDILFNIMSIFSERLAEESQLAYYFGDNNGRDSLWEYSLLQINDSPWWGYYPKIITSGYSDWTFGLHPHNYYLESVMTMGYLGSIPLFLYLLNTIFKYLYKFLTITDVPCFFSIILISEMVHGMFSGSLQYSDIWISLIGLGYYINNSNSEIKKKLLQ